VASISDFSRESLINCEFHLATARARTPAPTLNNLTCPYSGSVSVGISIGIFAVWRFFETLYGALGRLNFPAL